MYLALASRHLIDLARRDVSLLRQFVVEIIVLFLGKQGVTVVCGVTLLATMIAPNPPTTGIIGISTSVTVVTKFLSDSTVGDGGRHQWDGL